MEALLDDDIVQNGPCARVAPLPKRSAGGGVCFRSDDRRQAQLPLPAPLGPSVVAMAPAITSIEEPEPTFECTEGTEELRAESDLLADCGAVALCAPLSSLEGADPATRAAALHLARWFRARLSGQSVDGAATPPKNTGHAEDDGRHGPVPRAAHHAHDAQGQWRKRRLGRGDVLRQARGHVAVPDGARLRPGAEEPPKSDSGPPVRLRATRFFYRSKRRRL